MAGIPGAIALSTRQENRKEKESEEACLENLLADPEGHLDNME